MALVRGTSSNTVDLVANVSGGGLGSSNGTINDIISITATELENLITNNGIVPGTQYSVSSDSTSAGGLYIGVSSNEVDLIADTIQTYEAATTQDALTYSAANPTVFTFVAL